MGVDELGEPKVDVTCRTCSLPVVTASRDGPDLCVWCSSHRNRDGTPWTFDQMGRWFHKGTVKPLPSKGG